MSFKITWKTHILCLILSIIITVMLGNIPSMILDEFFAHDFILYPTQNILINFSFYIIILYIPLTCFHEFIHGSIYKIFGGKVKYGFKGIYAFTQEVSGKPVSRTEFLIILLSPVVIISLLSLVFNNWLVHMIFLLNVLGSSGDILMSLYLVRINYKSKIFDKSYGFDAL